MIESIKMDWDELKRIRSNLNDNHYYQYILHKANHPDYTWDKAEQHFLQDLPPMKSSWPYSEEWIASYWLYYDLNGKYLKNARMLDIGPAHNIYSVWSILNGVDHVHCVEPDTNSYNLGLEYIKIRNMQNHITSVNMSAENYMLQYDGTPYDVVMLGDVFGYLKDGPGLLDFIRNQVKAQYIFLETNVVDTNDDYVPGRIPSRTAMHKLIKNWNVLFYYDYKDFKGHGEGPGAVAGLKEFYVLERS